MESMEQILEAFNARLVADGFTERFILETKIFDNGNTQKMLVIPHKKEEFSIALYQVTDDEWVLEYFDFHSHLDFIDTLKELIEMAYEKIHSILSNEMTLIETDQPDEKFSAMTYCVPKEIPFAFSEAEKERAKKFRIYRWSGEIDDINVACYILRREGNHRFSAVSIIQ